MNDTTPCPLDETSKPLAEMQSEDITSLLHLASLLATLSQHVHRLDLGQVALTSQLGQVVKEFNDANRSLSARIKQGTESIQQVLKLLNDFNTRLSALEMLQKKGTVPPVV